MTGCAIHAGNDHALNSFSTNCQKMAQRLVQHAKKQGGTSNSTFGMELQSQPQQPPVGPQQAQQLPDGIGDGNQLDSMEQLPAGPSWASLVASGGGNQIHSTADVSGGQQAFSALGLPGMLSASCALQMDPSAMSLGNRNSGDSAVHAVYTMWQQE
jgi:hypothetical protein